MYSEEGKEDTTAGHRLYRLFGKWKNNHRLVLCSPDFTNLMENVLIWQRKIYPFVLRCNSELAPHPPYSPDLGPCDLFLFPNMKKWLAGIKSSSNEEVIAETEGYYADLDKPYFLEGLK